MPPAVERDQLEVVVMEITEIAALMEFLAFRFGFDLAESVTELYTKNYRSWRRRRLRGHFLTRLSWICADHRRGLK